MRKRILVLAVALVAVVAMVAVTLFVQSRYIQKLHTITEEGTQGALIETTPTPQPLAPIAPLTQTVPEPESTLAPQPTQSPTENSAEKISERDFERLAAKTLRSLPDKKQLQKLTEEEAHQTPRAIKEAGVELGRIAQVLHDQPEMAAQGLRFYDVCLKRESVPTSIRALCFSNARRISKKTGKSFVPGQLPDAVIHLADEIPAE